MLRYRPIILWNELCVSAFTDPLSWENDIAQSFQGRLWRYLNMDNAVIVRPLIAEAPMTAYQGINVPTIEQILVDIVSDKEFDYANGAEMYHIFKNW